MIKISIKFCKIFIIPFKIIRKIKFFFLYKTYKIKIFEKEQNKIFKRLNLNRPKGKKKILKIKNEVNYKDRKNQMSSEHEILFSSLSLRRNIIIKRILEIGTFDGVNSLLLSKIFPNSKIDTIDLPSTDLDFKNSYNRKNKVNQFINYRNDNLNGVSSINFIEKNSINLINQKKKYDLIWIDGAHGYPIVCADIINSLHLVNNEGIIICDDIFVNLLPSQSDKTYNSIAAYETLELLRKEKIISLQLIYKRLDPKSNCLNNERKFVAIFQKFKKVFKL